MNSSILTIQLYDVGTVSILVLQMGKYSMQRLGNLPVVTEL